MYTLAYPVTLPDDRAFHCDDRAVVPPIGTLRVSCREHKRDLPQIFNFTGFTDAESANAFADQLAQAFQCASLSIGHGFKLPDRAVTITEMSVFDGHTPSIFPTAIKAKPVTGVAYLTMSAHLATLSNQLGCAIESGAIDRLRNWPELATAVRLYSEAEFAGGATARFVVLLSALEVIVSGSGGKRGAVRRLVTDSIRKSGREDAKSVGKEIDRLYEARNALVHEAHPVSMLQLDALAAIVRDTLRYLVDGKPPV